ncbi:MAG: STAS domain-containing protein [Magnetococcales bacterium]|nr:STAS domain-containing protein [Magnetococcales bacterium]MBF0440142.1 STAS domain-containing protein [Magnetococcales bacterium]
MPLTVSKDADVVTITLNDQFIFSDHTPFLHAYTNNPPTTRYIIDFKRVNYMDSSALGMLLLLREACGEEQSRVKLLNCNPQVQKILEIANFTRLFTME